MLGDAGPRSWKPGKDGRRVLRVDLGDGGSSPPGPPSARLPQEIPHFDLR